MSTLVVGDVHGCAKELKKLVRMAKPNRVILVGDLFTKGPDPAGVWRQIRDHGYESTLGNHDLRLLKLKPKDKAGQRCAEALDAYDPAWRAWLETLPLFVDAEPFTVVHAGVHPHGSLAATSRNMAINMRRFPGKRPTDPFWWQEYDGQRRIVFGHDARRGLVRVERSGRPWLIGLDTGCVYGGQLSGYLVETDRLLQVPAKKKYQPV